MRPFGVQMLAVFVTAAFLAGAAALYLGEGTARECQSTRQRNLGQCPEQTEWWTVALAGAIASAGLAAGTAIVLAGGRSSTERSTARPHDGP